MDYTTYLIENASEILNQRAQEITQKLKTEDQLINQKPVDPEANIGVIEKKLDNYANFIQDRLGTRKKINEQERMTSIFLYHLKLDGKAKEIVEERMEAVTAREQIEKQNRKNE